MKKSHQCQNYFWFGFALFVLQFAGYGILPLGFLAVTSVLCFSVRRFQIDIKRNIPFILFISYALISGTLHSLFKIPSMRSIQVWGQFFFLSFLLLGIENKYAFSKTLQYVIYIIFIADITTNLLLLVGFTLPWAQLPPVRPDETFPRFVGVKNNQLYSGYITYAAISFYIAKEKTRKDYVVILFMVLNILLSGSYRYYVTMIFLGFTYCYKLYKKKRILYISYISTIILVFTMTLFSSIKNGNEGGNYNRIYLWGRTINGIMEAPLSGVGFFCQDLGDDFVADLDNLEDAGVTESGVLLIGLCYGIMGLFLYLRSLQRTLGNFTKYNKYMPELGLFLGISFDFFWGGSPENSLMLTLFFSSIYIINCKTQEYHAISNNSSL